jgi:hypothetical protein
MRSSRPVRGCGRAEPAREDRRVAPAGHTMNCCLDRTAFLRQVAHVSVVVLPILPRHRGVFRRSCGRDRRAHRPRSATTTISAPTTSAAMPHPRLRRAGTGTAPGAHKRRTPYAMQAVATNSSSYCCAPIAATVPGGDPSVQRIYRPFRTVSPAHDTATRHRSAATRPAARIFDGESLCGRGSCAGRRWDPRVRDRAQRGRTFSARGPFGPRPSL